MSKKDNIDKFLSEIGNIVKTLLSNAEKLRDLSDQVISKDELEPIQKKQAKLLKNLQKADDKYQNAFNGKADYTTEEGQQIAKMLHEFETLNEAFIKNLQKQQGIIQFDKKNKTKKKK